MSLLYANVSEEDILLRDELDALVNNHPDRLRVYYVLSKAPEGWQQGSGYITHDLMKERLFAAASDTLGLMCGPPGLLEHVAVPGFQAMGYAKDTLVQF